MGTIAQREKEAKGRPFASSCFTVNNTGKALKYNQLIKSEVKIMGWLYSKAMEAFKKDAEREKADYEKVKMNNNSK